MSMLLRKAGIVPLGKKIKQKGGNPYSMLQLQSSLLQMVLGGRFLRYLNTEPITEYLDN